MIESEPKPTGADEQHEQPKIEVWMVDDDSTLGRLWNEIASMDEKLLFRHFEKGEEAVQEIKHRVASGAELPHGIIVDGNLDKNDGFYKDGENIISTIQVLTEAHKTPP